MFFRFYTKQLSEATRGLAAVVFIVGMLLIGFAMLIFALPKLFAWLAAGVFFAIGLTTIGYAVRLFIAASRLDRDMPMVDDEDEAIIRRKHVDIRVEERE